MKAHFFVCQAVLSSGGSPTKRVEKGTVARGGVYCCNDVAPGKNREIIVTDEAK
jgi:hypothetical protein